MQRKVMEYAVPRSEPHRNKDLGDSNNGALVVIVVVKSITNGGQSTNSTEELACQFQLLVTWLCLGA